MTSASESSTAVSNAALDRRSEMQGSPYTPEFFEAERSGSERSAAVILPIVIDLIHPRSVIDIGCGAGSWLATFIHEGIADVTGVDGDWVKPESLRIPPDRFIRHDLRTLLTLPRHFDLVVCVEVAEHIAPEFADVLVESLTGLGPVVLFSAAIPHQGGVAHVNEQWPDYWRALFERRGFGVRDWLRTRVWNDDRVEAFYAQNMFLYARDGELSALDLRQSAGNLEGELPLAVVHPRVYLRSLELAAPTNIGLRRAMRALPTLVKRALARRVRNG